MSRQANFYGGKTGGRRPCIECGRPSVGRRLCSLHYQRAAVAGALPPKVSPEERYWERVARLGPDDCWEWLAYTSSKGYGQLGGKPAHRIGWEFVNGPIPPGLTVDHLCGSPGCQNVAHMELVTRGENVLRAKAPGGNCRKGHDDWAVESNGRGKVRRRCQTCRRESRS